MNQQSISDIYEANDLTRAKLKKLIASLSEHQLTFLPEGEKWTVTQLVEHIAIVEGGIVKISAKLLGAAQANGRTSDGNLKLSEEFMQKIANSGTQKFEAPERVHPKGDVGIEESFARLDENRRTLEELKPLFESVDETEVKFPHPAFGELTSHEWLLVLGGHERRHISQIKRILELIK